METHLALQALPLQVLIRPLEYLTCDVRVTGNHPRFYLLIFILCLLAERAWHRNRLRLEKRVCDPDLYMARELHEALVQLACALTLAFL